MTHRTCFLSYDNGGSPAVSVAGRLDLPGAEGPRPAVLICHGSDGVDGRGRFYAEALNALGVVTLEIDMWSARGVQRGAAARPATPLDTLPDAFAGLETLARQPEVDPARIAIMGFSWGGVVTLLSAVEGVASRFSPSGQRFCAHAAMYPVCWAYGRVSGLALEDLTGAPVLLQTGDADAYDEPDGGAQLLARMTPEDRAHVELVTHAGAGHGYDRNLPTQVINDPFAHCGKGGPVEMAYHPEAAAASRGHVSRFFTEAFGL